MNRQPLDQFLAREFKDSNSRRSFVSFNYDLILDSAIQRASGEWHPSDDYGFNIGLYVDGQLQAEDLNTGPLLAKRLHPSGETGPVTLLKPHGSLNWLARYEIPFVQTQQGTQFKDEPLIISLGPNGDIRYWCSTQSFQYVRDPDKEAPDTVGPCILPPSPAKTANLAFLKEIHCREAAALREADEVCIIGWSCPQSDGDQADLIKASIEERNHPLKTLTIVDRNAEAEHFERLQSLFRVPCPDVRRHNSGFVDFVSNCR